MGAVITISPRLSKWLIGAVGPIYRIRIKDSVTGRSMALSGLNPALCAGQIVGPTGAPATGQGTGLPAVSSLRGTFVVEDANAGLVTYQPDAEDLPMAVPSQRAYSVGLVGTTNPKIYWRLNDLGTLSRDWSNTIAPLAGTLTGLPAGSRGQRGPFTGFDPSNRSMLFDGSTSYVVLAQAVPNGAIRVIGAWIKMTAAPTGTNMAVIAYQGRADLDGYGLGVKLFGTRPRLVQIINGTATDTGYEVPLNAWIFVSLSITASVGSPFVNGQATPYTGLSASANAPTVDFSVGAGLGAAQAPVAGTFFTGYICEVFAEGAAALSAATLQTYLNNAFTPQCQPGRYNLRLAFNPTTSPAVQTEDYPFDVAAAA